MPGTMVINEGQGRLSVDHYPQPRIIPGFCLAIPLGAPKIVVLLTVELIQMQVKAAKMPGAASIGSPSPLPWVSGS